MTSKSRSPAKKKSQVKETRTPYAFLPIALQIGMARIRGLPLSPELKAAAARLEGTQETPKETKNQKKPEIGQLVKGQGIFLGTWLPRTRTGASIGKTFNVFACPNNLPGKRSYTNTLRSLDKLAWHGHLGEPYETNTSLVDALKNGTYKGGWVIPPLELLCGISREQAVIGTRTDIPEQPDNLFDHRQKGDLGKSFQETAHKKQNSSGLDSTYFSSSKSVNDPSSVFCVDFRNGYILTTMLGGTSYRSRLVRLVEVKNNPPGRLLKQHPF